MTMTSLYFVRCRVVLADLVLHGKSYGPHAFLLALREDQDGPLVPGVTVGDMGHKTVGNDLDNAWVSGTICDVLKVK